MLKSKIEAIATLRKLQDRKMDLHDMKTFVEAVMALGVEDYKKDQFVKDSLSTLTKVQEAWKPGDVDRQSGAFSDEEKDPGYHDMGH